MALLCFVYRKTESNENVFVHMALRQTSVTNAIPVLDTLNEPSKRIIIHFPRFERTYVTHTHTEKE